MSVSCLPFVIMCLSLSIKRSLPISIQIFCELLSSGITTGSSFTEGVGKLITPVVGGERGGREFSEEGQIEVMKLQHSKVMVNLSGRERRVGVKPSCFAVWVLFFSIESFCH